MLKLALPMHTERLTLRAFRAEDWEDLHTYLSDADTVFFEPYDAYTKEQARAEAQRRASDPAFIAVCLEDRLIGNLYLGQGDDPDVMHLGYILNKDYRGQGFALEAARAAVGVAFAFGIRRIEAGCAENNPHSWRLLERLGMRLIEKIPHAVTFKKDNQGRDIWLDARRYELVNPMI